MTWIIAVVLGVGIGIAVGIGVTTDDHFNPKE